MPKSRFLRYGLRTFLAVITVVAVLLGRFMHQVHKQRAAVAWVEANGGIVLYDFERFDPSVSIDDRAPGPAWIRSLIGIDAIATVLQVDLRPLTVRTMEYDWSRGDLADVSPLAELKSLQSLHLCNTQVSDVSPLSDLKSLQSLALSNTQISDISHLSDLKSLQVLDLSITKVSDVSPLEKLPSLKWVDLELTHVSDESVESLKKAIPNLEVRR